MAAPRSRKRRAYSSEVRESAKDETRQGIIQAVITVILHEGVHAFTMQNVADKAGISLRTVYRHFESREQLLEGLSDHVDRAVEALGIRHPTTIAEGEALVRPLFSKFGVIQDALRASVIASIATRHAAKGYRQRRALLLDMLTAACPNLSAGELKEANAIVGTLSGSRAWYVMTSELGLDSEQAGRAAEWALRTLLADLRKRNANKN